MPGAYRHFERFFPITDGNCSRKKALAFFAAVEKNRCPKKNSGRRPSVRPTVVRVPPTRDFDYRRAEGRPQSSSGHFHASVTRLPRLPRLPKPLALSPGAAERRSAMAEAAAECDANGASFDDAGLYSVDGFRVRHATPMNSVQPRPTGPTFRAQVYLITIHRVQAYFIQTFTRWQ